MSPDISEKIVFSGMSILAKTLSPDPKYFSESLTTEYLKSTGSPKWTNRICENLDMSFNLKASLIF